MEDSQASDPLHERIREAMAVLRPSIVANTDKLSAQMTRRLIEAYLGLPPYALEPYRKFVKMLVEELISELNERVLRRGQERLHRPPVPGNSSTLSDDQRATSKPT